MAPFGGWRPSCLGILLLAATTFGQSPLPSGNLYGTVVDEQGKPLAGVTATLTGPGAAQSATTDTKGDFHFLNLSPGAYTVTLELTGFETVRRDVTVLLGKNAVLSVTMPVAGAAEAVTVSGADAASWTAGRPRPARLTTRRSFRAFPTTRDPGRSCGRFPAVLLFNVNVGGEDSGSSRVSSGRARTRTRTPTTSTASGSPRRNGQTPIYFDFDSLDNIEVVTGGTDPSLSTPGVTLNLVTKRGTNQILGSARVLYTEAAGWDYGVEAGGPLWKDRLWLWGAFARDSPSGPDGFDTATGDPGPFQPTIEHWNAKLNAQLAPANSLTFSYLDSDKTNPGKYAGQDRSPASTVNQMFPTSAYRLEDSQVFSAKSLRVPLPLLSAVQHHATRPTAASTSRPISTQYGVWQNSYTFYDSKRPQYQAGADCIRLLRHRRPPARAQVRLRLQAGSERFADDRGPETELVGNEPIDPRPRRSRRTPRE